MGLGVLAYLIVSSGYVMIEAPRAANPPAPMI